MPAELSAVIERLCEQSDLPRMDFLHDLADRCDLSYQTAKNISDGKSVSAKVILRIIDEYKLEQQPDLLRSLLIGFLRAQFDPNDSERLLQIAELDR